jgi:uncharacterized membrane protein
MIWLALGVLLWSAAHLLPSVAPATRSRWIEGLGEQPYKGCFSLTLIAAIVMMVVGWRGSAFVPVYGSPPWAALAANVGVFIGLLLFVASGVPTNLKRWIRHPQLTGVALWAGFHLLANGDQRSLLLFGGLGSWAILCMLSINRRDGAWQKPEPLPASAELKPLLGAIFLYALLFFAHPYIAGVSPMPH